MIKNNDEIIRKKLVAISVVRNPVNSVVRNNVCMEKFVLVSPLAEN